MANPGHLTKLKESVEAWNKWWKDKPKIRRDLTEANLTEANLTEANLRKADLGYASLTGAVL
ncbi:MAG: pentapeptide repeat-containing protein, partial [Deltaproteobacteria bacterium]|nr:pentapeptide repeat-containing protein [Deltaproteobacteria bacterium]